MRKNTPIETYEAGGRTIHVKREDLCGPEGSPPFSKMRGVYTYLSERKEKGLRVVGYTETSISMAGWGVAWACQQLGLQAVIYDPQYKEPHEVLKIHRKHWKKCNATIRKVEAGMARVNYHICRKRLRNEFGKEAEMLDLGLPLEQTIHETAREFQRTLKKITLRTVVCCVGSGTIFAGLLRKLPEGCKAFGIMCRTGNVIQKKKKILFKAKKVEGGITGIKRKNLKLVDLGWEYTERSEEPCPFPCHAFYDRKAWQWLMRTHRPIEEPILFWNIGHEGEWI